MTADHIEPTKTAAYPAAVPSTIAYFAAFVALGMVTAVIGPALPGLSEQTGTTLAQVGLLFTAQNFGYMLGSLGIGNLLDRLRGNKMLAFVLISMTVLFALIPLATELWVLLVIMLFLGIAYGGLDISCNVLLVWVHRDRSNPFLNALHFFFGVGAFLAPILVAQSLLLGGNVRWAFWLLACYPIPFALWLMRIPSPLSPGAVGDVERRPVHWLLVILITLVFVLYVGAELGFGGWIYTYVTSLDLADAAGAAYITALFWGSLTVGRLFGIAIATRVRPATIVFADLVGCLLSVSLIWLRPGSITAVWAGSIGLGLFMASIFATLLAFAERYITMSGQVSRWFFVGTGLGGMIMPLLLGALIERVGPMAFIPALFLDLSLALLVFVTARIVAENPWRATNGV